MSAYAASLHTRARVTTAARHPWRIFGAFALTSGILLALAALLRGTVELVYNDPGSGCRQLTAASATNLKWVLAPVRVVLAVLIAGSSVVGARRRIAREVSWGAADDNLDSPCVGACYVAVS